MSTRLIVQSSKLTHVVVSIVNVSVADAAVLDVQLDIVISADVALNLYLRKVRLFGGLGKRKRRLHLYNLCWPHGLFGRQHCSTFYHVWSGFEILALTGPLVPRYSIFSPTHCNTEQTKKTVACQCRRI